MSIDVNAEDLLGSIPIHSFWHFYTSTWEKDIWRTKDNLAGQGSYAPGATAEEAITMAFNGEQLPKGRKIESVNPERISIYFKVTFRVEDHVPVHIVRMEFAHRFSSSTARNEIPPTLHALLAINRLEGDWRPRNEGYCGIRDDGQYTQVFAVKVKATNSWERLKLRGSALIGFVALNFFLNRIDPVVGRWTSFCFLATIYFLGYYINQLEKRVERLESARE